VKARWEQYYKMPTRNDVGLCECCGGTALITAHREIITGWLNESGDHESGMIEIADKVLCSRCEEKP
jgi:hypothetical protein